MVFVWKVLHFSKNRFSRFSELPGAKKTSQKPFRLVNYEVLVGENVKSFGLAAFLADKPWPNWCPPTPLSTRKNRGFALWDLQKSRFGQGLALKSAAKPMDFTFSLKKTLCFTRRNGFLDVVLAPGGSKNLKK